jgi:dTDP-4-amino-4,6-dideoxygalactose transaminase
MKLPLIKPDLPALDAVSGQFEEILCNGRITNFGRYVQQFEAETGAYLNASTVALSSGTVGLIFSLSALGLQRGAKVILPSFTFVATAQAILAAGGVPLFAEVEDDLTLSPADVAQLLAKHDDVGAVIGVHMYGLPARVRELEALVAAESARRGRKIPLIFDAAHAFGSSVGGQVVGGFGDAEVFSLSVTKVLVSVEGGLVSTKHPEVADAIKSMRNYGIQSNYNSHFFGLNGKMSEFHAIVGLYNLKRFDSLMEERQKKAAYLRDGIEKSTVFRLSCWPENVRHTFKDFTIMLSPEAQPKRDALMRFLADNGIETRAYFYPPVHEQDYFRQYADRPLPRTESLARRVITLPFFTTISEPEMEFLIESLKKAERECL